MGTGSTGTGSMGTKRTILLGGAAAATRWSDEIEAAGVAATEVRKLLPAAPEDPRAWQRAASELALYPWVVALGDAAADALVEVCGGPIAATVRVAATSDAAALLTSVGSSVAIERPGPGALLGELTAHLGRQERVLLPVASGTVGLGAAIDSAGGDRCEVIAYQPRSAVTEAVSRIRGSVAQTWQEVETIAALPALDGRRPQLLPIVVTDEEGAAAARAFGFVSIHAAAGSIAPLLD